jgi:hypothetical protein
LLPVRATPTPSLFLLVKFGDLAFCKNRKLYIFISQSNRIAKNYLHICEPRMSYAYLLSFSISLLPPTPPPHLPAAPRMVAGGGAAHPPRESSRPPRWIDDIHFHLHLPSLLLHFPTARAHAGSRKASTCEPSRDVARCGNARGLAPRAGGRRKPLRLRASSDKHLLLLHY